MKKKRFQLIILVGLLILAGCNISNAQNDEANAIKKAAEDMIYDVSHNTIHHFNWLLPNEVSQVFKNPKAADKIRSDIYNLSEMLEMLAENKADGIEAGLDWNDVIITDIRYTGEYDSYWDAEEIKGYIYVKSHGKPYRIFFKRCFMLNGKCRAMQFRFIEQTSEIESDYPHSGRNE